jgi:hypothetical protein
MVKLLVDSVDRQDGGTQEKYTQKFPFPIKNPKRVALISASIPKSMYPIQTGYNSVFTCIVDSSTTETITIAEGFYTGAEYAAALTALLTAAFSGVVCNFTYDATLNKLHASPQGGSTLKFLIGATDDPKTLYTMGWQSLDGTLFSLNRDAPDMLDLSYPRYLTVDVEAGNGFGNNLMTSKRKYSFMVPLSVDSLEITEFTSQSGFQQIESSGNTSFDELSIQIHQPDRDNNTSTSFLNGIEHQFLFEVET